MKRKVIYKTYLRDKTFVDHNPVQTNDSSDDNGIRACHNYQFKTIVDFQAA